METKSETAEAPPEQPIFAEPAKAEPAKAEPANTEAPPPAAKPEARAPRLPASAQIEDLFAAVRRLEAFASLNGPAFYRLPVNETRLRLVKRDQPHAFPPKIFTEAGPVTVFNPGIPVRLHVGS